MVNSMNCSLYATKHEEQSTFEVDCDNDTLPDYVYRKVASITRVSNSKTKLFSKGHST